MAERVRAKTEADFWRWMDKERGYSRVTREGRLRHIQTAERYVRATYGLELLRAETEDLKSYLARCAHNKTRNSYLCDLRCFFEFAVERGLCKTDPPSASAASASPCTFPGR